MGGRSGSTPPAATKSQRIERTCAKLALRVRKRRTLPFAKIARGFRTTRAARAMRTSDLACKRDTCSFLAGIKLS